MKIKYLLLSMLAVGFLSLSVHSQTPGPLTAGATPLKVSAKADTPTAPASTAIPYPPKVAKDKNVRDFAIAFFSFIFLFIIGYLIVRRMPAFKVQKKIEKKKKKKLKP